MARQPSWIDKVNFIRFWLGNNCDFPFTVYYETALPALGRQVLVLLSFGLLDVIRGFFRPAGLRRGRHGRKGRRGRRGREAIPEMGETVGKRIPGQRTVARRQVTDGVRNLWIVDSWVQRFAYKLLIITVIADFWYDWSSTIVQDRRTTCDGIARGMREDDSHVFTPGGWGQLLVHDLVYLEGPVPFGPGSVSFPAGKYLLTVACKAKIFGPGTNAQAQIGLALTDDLNEFVDVSSRVDLTAGSVADLVTSFPVQGPGRLTYRGIALNNPVNFHEITAFFMQHGD